MQAKALNRRRANNLNWATRLHRRPEVICLVRAKIRFWAIHRRFRQMLTKPHRTLRGKVTKAFLAVLEGVALHHFVVRVASDSPFKLGRIHAIARMDCYRVSPYILVDYFLAEKTDSNDLKPLVHAFTKTEVKEIVLFVARNFDRPGEVFEKLSKLDVFRGVTVSQIKDAFSVKKVRKFINLVCAFAEIEIPAEARKVFVVFCLGPIMEAFLHHETELTDLYGLVKELVVENSELMAVALDFMA